MLKPKVEISTRSVGSFVRNHGALFAILSLGACLRIYQLGTESLWLDEGVSAAFANLGGPLEIVEQSKTDNNFPTYYLILHYWVGLFGDSEFSVRFPSALAGIFAVFVMYKVGYLLFGYGTGLMASLILALSPAHISLSQEARVYSLMTLLALLSFYFFAKVLEKRNPPAQIGYVLSTSALMYSHVYGLFILLAQNIYLATAFLRRAFGPKDEVRQGWGGWILLQTLLFVLYIPGFVLLAGWILNPAERLWIQPPSLGSVYDSFINYAGNRPLLMLLLTFSLLAAVQLVRSGAGGKLYLLLLWLLTPVALPVAISSFSTPIFTTRYAIVATPALYLLAAKGVEVASSVFSGSLFRGIPQAAKANTVWLATAAVLIVLFSRGLWGYFNTVDNTQWREVAQYVNAHAQTNDLVLLYPDYDIRVFDHYFERTDVEKEPVTYTDMKKEPVLHADTRKHNRVWAIEDQNDQNELFPNSFFEGSYTPIYHERYKDLDVTLYEKK